MSYYCLVNEKLLVSYCYSGEFNVLLSYIRNIFSHVDSKVERSPTKNNSVPQKTSGDYLGKKTFTYYIPAPPQRKNGYQEKEFDHIFSYLMQEGFDIIDFKLVSGSGENSNGMWIVCLLGALTQEALERELDIDYAQIASLRQTTIQLDPSIEHEC